MFSAYMRFFLTPISLMTWANLNHTLCGTDSDPVWYLFGLGKWYYPIAEIYLGAFATLAILGNYAICWVVKRVILGDKSCSHELNTPSEDNEKKTS